MRDLLLNTAHAYLTHTVYVAVIYPCVHSNASALAVYKRCLRLALKIKYRSTFTVAKVKEFSAHFKISILYLQGPLSRPAANDP